MKYKPLDSVVLTRDYDQYGLRTGDLGAVVEVYDPNRLEVEFVSASVQQTNGLATALSTIDGNDRSDRSLMRNRVPTRVAAGIGRGAKRARGRLGPRAVGAPPHTQ